MNHYLKPLVSFLLPRQNICEEYPKKAKKISNLFHIHKNKNRIMKKRKRKREKETMDKKLQETKIEKTGYYY